MEIPLTGMAAELLFIAVVAACVFVFALEITLHLTIGQWTQPSKPRKPRPRFPWTDRTRT
jgi:hypothetical protein